MSREATSDFTALLNYLNDYSLEENATLEPFKRDLKAWHKKLFSLLVFDAELSQWNNNALMGPEGTLYLAESCSDLAQACFCWVHGAYKPSAIMLRSGIETFVKACTCKELPTILTETSVFRLMDRAAGSTTFQGDNAPFFDRIRNEYGNLCAVVHSATPHDFAAIGALRHFPKFSASVASPLSKQACVILDRILGVLLNKARPLLKHFHFRNRQIFLDGIPPSIKGPILQRDD